MRRTALVFRADRTGYAIDQVADRAMTVGELINILQDYDENDIVILSHDRGYTYGSLDFIYEATEDEDGEFEEQEEDRW